MKSGSAAKTEAASDRRSAPDPPADRAAREPVSAAEVDGARVGDDNWGKPS
jgi:hypothetical protein